MIGLEGIEDQAVLGELRLLEAIRQREGELLAAILYSSTSFKSVLLSCLSVDARVAYAKDKRRRIQRGDRREL